MGESTRMSLLDEIRRTYSSERWGEFFSAYGNQLSRWLVAQQVSPIDADDIRQETMLVVVKELPKFEHNGRTGAFRSWLKTILTNRMRQQFRKKRNRNEVSNLESLADQLEDEQSKTSLEFQKEHDQFVIRLLLSKAESKFSKSRVKMFRELVLEQRPIEEVCEKFQMTKGAVRVQQHRILQWLKEYGTGFLELED